MEKILEFLQENPTFYYATVEGDAARVRPFGFYMEYEGKLYFGMGKHKASYRQTLAHPQVEICTADKQGRWIRIRGTAVFDDRPEVSARAFAVMPSLRDIYNETSGLTLAVFYLSHAVAEIADMQGHFEAIPFQWEPSRSNEILQNILTRRSCRAFTGQKISREDLTLLVDAARYAPSGMNKQLWHFTVVQNPDSIAQLAAAIGAATGNSAYDFYRPNALILASNESGNPHGVEDCACALENVFLAAHALGIGSVWINQLRHVCDTAEVRKLLCDYGVPADHAVYGVAALGYPAAAAGNALKKEDVVSWVL